MRTVSKMISLLVMAFFLSGLFGLYTVACRFLLQAYTVACRFVKHFFSAAGCSPYGGKFFQRPRRRCFFRAGVLCFTRGRAAANSPPVPDCQASGDVVRGLAPGALLVHQVAEPLAELSMVLHSSASIKSRSRSASWACCTSNSPVFGVVMFTSPFWSPLAAVRWAVAAGPSACPG